jgi:hypothetical protein
MLSSGIPEYHKHNHIVRNYEVFIEIQMQEITSCAIFFDEIFNIIN